ncbi:MAG TPA: C4-dicarboxylate transporter DctA [Verrucomicrobiae bacterium]|nr:C4-dicarboxylate transporter DctA [Verrucomicrobiae bacterium]
MEKTRSRTGALFGNLFFQVVLGVAVGVLIGVVNPPLGVSLKALGDGFINLIKMLLAPIIFGTIVTGIAKMGSLKEVGRVGVKALVYFQVVSMLALVMGLVVANVLKPGAGMNIDPATLDAGAVASYTTTAKSQSVVGFFLDIIPSSVGDVFVRGNMLPVILFSVLFGLALAQMPDRGGVIVAVIDSALHGFFGIVRMIMWLAPLGALGAMAFTVGKYGLASLKPLGWLIAGVYFTSLIFIVCVLGLIARASRISFWKFLRYIRDELAIVFATSSTEAVLPQIMAKLEDLGCAKPVVGMVLPTGYTFNADGTSIYLTMAAIFVAQATNTHLSFGDEMLLLGVLVLTSKGSAGVAGAGFVTLAATLASMGKIPVAGMALLLGVDRFVNQARAVTNLIGNGVATIVVARWEKAFDEKQAEAVLNGQEELKT